MAMTTAPEAERIRELHGSGLSVAAIAERTGFKARRVYAIVQGATRGRPLTARERMARDREAGWAPLCMDAAEWADWQASNPLRVRGAVSRPCADCLLGFAADMRAAGRCNGSPGSDGGEADDHLVPTTTTAEEDDDMAARGPMSDEARQRIAAGRRAQIDRDRAQRERDERSAARLGIELPPIVVEGTGAAAFDAAVQRALEGSGVEVHTSFTPSEPEPYTDANDVDFGEGAPNAADREMDDDDPVDGSPAYDESEDDFPQRFAPEETALPTEPNVVPIGASRAAEILLGLSKPHVCPEPDVLLEAYREVRAFAEADPHATVSELRDQMARRIADRAADAA